LRNELARQKIGVSPCSPARSQEFIANLLSGIDYYRRHASRLAGASCDEFLAELDALQRDAQSLLALAAA
jgi:hypothetical protein